MSASADFEPERITWEDTTPSKISLGDQIAEAIESYAYMVRENEDKVARKVYDEKHALTRQHRRLAILATLKWLQSNETVIREVVRIEKARQSAGTL